MRVIWMMALVALVFMSLAAGGAKVFRMPQEIAFFESAGLALAWLYPLGGAQIAGGILSTIPKSRKIGLTLMGLGFLVSTIVIFMVGQFGFALISLLPVVVSVLLILRDNAQN
ncbi:MAG: hypothetical protein HKN14_02185 [Marinicaulis sp.]|nr:hypothetical protein [Marinicaulis sp.]